MYVREDNHGGHPVCRGRTIKIQNTWEFFGPKLSFYTYNNVINSITLITFHDYIIDYYGITLFWLNKKLYKNKQLKYHYFNQVNIKRHRYQSCKRYFLKVFKYRYRYLFSKYEYIYLINQS